MAGDYLLDTNILIPYIDGEATVFQKVISTPSIFVPFNVLGELYFGARNSSRASQNISKVDQVASRFPILYPTLLTVTEYSTTRAKLKSIGRPIPESDLWIAALAIQYGFVLVTRDGHFSRIDRLRVEIW